MRAPEYMKLSKIKTRLTAIMNAKGGVGKTTVAVLLSKALAAKGRKVLLIDGDAQANTTEMFNFCMEDINSDRNVKCLIDGKGVPMEEYTIYDADPGIDLIPSHLQLYLEERNLSVKSASSANFPEGLVIRNFFEDNAEYLERYDNIIVDLGPYMGMLAENIFAVADAVILPVTGNDSLTGVLTTLAMWRAGKRSIMENFGGLPLEDAEVLGDDYDNFAIVMNKLDLRTRESRHIYDILKGKNLSEREEVLYGDYYTAFVEPPIPVSARVSEQSITHRLVMDLNTKDAVKARKAVNDLLKALMKGEYL